MCAIEETSCTVCAAGRGDGGEGEGIDSLGMARPEGETGAEAGAGGGAGDSSLEEAEEEECCSFSIADLAALRSKRVAEHSGTLRDADGRTRTGAEVEELSLAAGMAVEGCRSAAESVLLSPGC